MAKLLAAPGRQKTKPKPETENETDMPLVNVKMLEGVFTPKQKQEMIRKLTDTMVSIEGENMRAVTLVILEEIKSGDWAVGGNAFTTDEVKALAAGSTKS